MELDVARVRRGVARLMRQWVPHNGQFRPTGLQASSLVLASQPGSGVAYTGVYPAYTSELAVPELYRTYAPSYYEPVSATEQVGAAFVLQLPDGRISVEDVHALAVLTADGQLVGDASLQFDPHTFAPAPPAANAIFRQRYFRAPRVVEGTVCSLLAGGGAAIGNYYHWLLDSLPRLHLVEQAGLLAEVDYFLIYNRQHRFAVEMLRELGIPEERIIDVQDNPHLRARRLIVTSHVRNGGLHAPDWVGPYLRRAFQHLPSGTEEPASPYVYVSRRDAAFRRVQNEAAVERLLAEYGFRSYALSELNLRQKVALFGGARVVAGPVGAGLANLLFSQPGTALIELLPRSMVVADYLDLTTRLRMPHYPLVCDTPTAARTAAEGRNADLTADQPALRQALEQALAQVAV
ncbi:glycosyltransferase family 61 protein [Hymenobacter sp. CRA2]|uniref:glycosyltransferase family 61 protein n=1 Tax=Hymenobacter sp. CRA2 TaxID=1955620 RepID=UPI00098F49B2|nr:glycosyltransferase family 61 protein [Hymenobacter sp. CRA2]OON66058.1 hypothetical protein B0919_22770 [Hymenobacter sp. CRA2]